VQLPDHGAASSSRFDVDAVSIMSGLRSSEKFLVGGTSTGQYCSKALEGQGFSMFLTASISVDFILLRRPGLADSCR